MRACSVVGAARNPETLADLVDTFGGTILPLTLDVTDRAADFEAVAHVQNTNLDGSMRSGLVRMMVAWGSAEAKRSSSSRESHTERSRTPCVRAWH
jgi:hypothetical protein